MTDVGERAVQQQGEEGSQPIVWSPAYEHALHDDEGRLESQTVAHRLDTPIVCRSEPFCPQVEHRSLKLLLGLRLHRVWSAQDRLDENQAAMVHCLRS